MLCMIGPNTSRDMCASFTRYKIQFKLSTITIIIVQLVCILMLYVCMYDVDI